MRADGRGRAAGHMDVITMGRTQLVFVPFCGAEFDWAELVRCERNDTDVRYQPPSHVKEPASIREDACVSRAATVPPPGSGRSAGLPGRRASPHPSEYRPRHCMAKSFRTNCRTVLRITASLRSWPTAWADMSAARRALAPRLCSSVSLDPDRRRSPVPPAIILDDAPVGGQ